MKSLKYFRKSEIRKYFSMRETKKSLKLDLIVLFLIFLSFFIFVALTFELNPVIKSVLLFLDYFIMILFTIEFFLRMYVTKDINKFFRSKFIWIDFLTIFPFWLGFTDLQFLRILRFFRLYRYSEKYLNFGHLLDHKKFQKLFMMKIIFTLFSVFCISAGLIYVAEHNVNSGINTFMDALYFTIVTVTTVGFGDIIPMTEMGRWVVVLTILTGIILVPYYVTIMVKFITVTSKKRRVRCKFCGLKYHEHDANFCKACGHGIFHVHDDEHFLR